MTAEDQKKYEWTKNRDEQFHQIYRSWRDAEIMHTILSMVGLFLAVFSYEYGQHMIEDSPNRIIDMDEYPDPMDHPLNSFPWVNPIRMIIAATSLLSFIFLIIRHYYKKKWLNEFFAAAHSRNSQGVPDLFR